MRNERKQFLLYVSPWIFGFLVFSAGPMLVSLYLSFTEYDILSPNVWIGANNYIELVTNERFWSSLWNTFYYTIVGVPLSVLLGLLVSVLLLRAIPGITLFRTAFYMPAIFGGVAILLLWNYMLAPGVDGQNVGLVNAMLNLIGIDGPGWSSDASWAKPSVILVKLWGVGGHLLIFLPALSSVPKELHEAADIDGASPFRKFWSITFPAISPAVLFVATMETIGTLKMFIEPMIITGLDPAWTDTLMIHLYNNAFEYFRMGYASALAWIMFVIILIITILNLYFSKKWVYYDYE